MMNDAAFDDVMAQLDAHGTEQNRKIYARHGVGENMFGVSYGNLRLLAKKYKKQTALAQQLWQSGNHDARVFATLILDPKQMTDELIDTWANDLDNYVLCDALSDVVIKMKDIKPRMAQWVQSDNEWIARIGWRMFAHLAMKDADLPDSYFEDYLVMIEQTIHTSKNRVRDAMNSALISAGIRNPALEEAAIAIARRIGVVEVDHGETGCVTPDAEKYIRRTLERKHKRQ